MIPLISRLSLTDYLVVVLLYVETAISSVLGLIPQPVFNFFHSIISYSVNTDDSTIEEKLRECPTIHEMCALFGIAVEDHLVRTEDNYILTLHRIAPQPGTFNGKAVYLHHGLLMCSDVWVCQADRGKNLPFVLHDMGYDVWMGNNRGNKYSTAHLYYPPKSNKFWDFSIDEFAFFDIPNSIQFVLDFVKVPKVLCIGFSQGSAQMFAAFSLDEKLNQKVSQFIAIAPAMTPKRLHNSLADTIAKSSPSLMYLFFGRNIILPSAVTWQRTIHPTVFNKLIDLGNRILFNWKSFNITPQQKLACYAKLYSTTSVKSIVHWFQILRSQKFSMFEESDDMFNSMTRPYMIPTFPTRTNIKIPILLIYGGNDLLVDIKVMKRNLPATSVFDVMVEGHEHLDLIWGQYTDTLVIAKVLKFVAFFDSIGAAGLSPGSRRNSILNDDPEVLAPTASVTSSNGSPLNVPRLLNGVPISPRNSSGGLPPMASSHTLTAKVLLSPGTAAQSRTSPLSQSIRRDSTEATEVDPLVTPGQDADDIAQEQDLQEQPYDDALEDIREEVEEDLDDLDDDDEDADAPDSFLDEATVQQNKRQRRRLTRYLSNEA
ncbi:sterol esterase [Maudiozyma humilis]|uniref:Sterol esterase n=1 Tax=Maudiozyma humilis TaxID=51915 RepID=A0AAV5RQX8_MAUHU|nr:sterol esterase [Kazachstania humilis]